MSSSSEENYLTALLSEREKLLQYRSILPICGKLMEAEIKRVQANLGIDDSTNAPYTSMYLHAPIKTDGPKYSEKVMVPVEKYPDFNFVGRILGPRGNSLKRIEQEARCKVLIRGRGSMRDKQKEDERRGKQGFEHLSEPLHVIIEADSEEGVHKAREIIDKLMVPAEDTEDWIKKSQLKELAMLKGTSGPAAAVAPPPLPDTSYRLSAPPPPPLPETAYRLSAPPPQPAVYNVLSYQTHYDPAAQGRGPAFKRQRSTEQYYHRP